VSPVPRGSRPRPRSVGAGAFFTLLLVGVSTGSGPGQVAGQVPEVGPPVATDTVPDAPLPVAADTVPDAPPPVAEVVDTVPPEPEPPPTLPAMPAVGPSGWDAGVWEWSRTDLLRLPELSLLHLLERIPGVTPVRVASVGQPEGAAVFGATVGAITYEVDGFELDPLTTPTFDPSRFPLVALESVRVERRVTGARVRIRTVSPGDARPLSVIEAGTGDLGTNLFRGTFLAPRVLGGGLSFGFESLGSQTILGGQSTFTGGWLKWTWARDEGGVQVEYRQSGMDRAGTGVALSGLRRDWVVRARRHLGPVVAEGYAGASSVEDELGDIVLREGTPQGGLRLSSSVVAPFPVEATGALRLRSHPRLPAQEAELSVWAAPTPWLGVGIEGAEGRRAEGSPTGRWALRGRVGPVAGLTAFADLARDRHALVGAVAASDPTDPDPATPDDPIARARLDLARNGARAGIQFQYGTLRLGAAAVRTSADSAAGFGLAFDPTVPRFAGGEATGVEVTVRAPTGWAPLRVEGWYVGMEVPPSGLYLPADQWRAALVFHDLPLPTGNLELYGRAEHRYRGPMLVPADGEAVVVPEHRSTHLEVTIRVLTVRAFVRWDNVLNRPFRRDVPGYNLPGQHVVYGVKWEFWN
jgi:hypothetical protein